MLHEFGGPEVLKMGTEPEPGTLPAGSVLVRIEAAGVNFIDIYQRTGLYKNPLPYAIGLEGSGIVVRASDDVTWVTHGDRVAWTGVPGSYADANVIPADRLVVLPEAVGTHTAAAVMLQGMTVHYLTHSTYRLGRDDTCLVHAAAGGVGLLLCQVARKAGAKVIGTAGSKEKAELARQAGAHKVILYKEQDFEAEVKKLTKGRGVQVVYDSVGRDTFERSLNCLAPRGMLVLFGQSSGPVPPIDPGILAAKGSLFLTRPSLFHYVATRDDLLWRAGEVLGWVADGSLKVRIGAEYPLEKAADAHRALESRGTTGKLLLIP